MKKQVCLPLALIFALGLSGCAQIEARVQIREGNDKYKAEDYAGAIKNYERARQIDGKSFPELDRMIGYSSIGLYKAEDASPENNKIADRGIEELKRYLQKRPDDTVARENLINLFLNAERTSQAIDFFLESLKKNPNDLPTVRSVAALYAKEGNFPEALKWYERTAQLDRNNPDAYYTFGVVLYEKVAKNPDPDVNANLAYIEKGKQSLQRALALNKESFEANVYMNLLFREQAKLMTDPAQQQVLLQEADVYRNRAVAISKAKKAAQAAAAK